MKQRLFVVVLAALTSTASGIAFQDGPDRLSEAEATVVSALLEQEARHPEKPRPILVLTPTETSIPDQPGTRPDDFPIDQWERQTIPPALREANRQPASLQGIRLPDGARLFSRQSYIEARSSPEAFQKLVAQLGGVEPLVLRVSRPVQVSPTRAVLLLHVDSTWSDEGGINMFSVDCSQRPCGVDLDSVVAFW